MISLQTSLAHFHALDEILEGIETANDLTPYCERLSPFLIYCKYLVMEGASSSRTNSNDITVIERNFDRLHHLVMAFSRAKVRKTARFEVEASDLQIIGEASEDETIACASSPSFTRPPKKEKNVKHSAHKGKNSRNHITTVPQLDSVTEGVPICLEGRSLDETAWTETQELGDETTSDVVCVLPQTGDESEDVAYERCVREWEGGQDIDTIDLKGVKIGGKKLNILSKKYLDTSNFADLDLQDEESEAFTNKLDEAKFIAQQ